MSDVEKWTWNDAMVMERKGGSYERVSPQRIMKRIADLERERDALRVRIKMLEDREQLACEMIAETGKPKLQARRLAAENDELRALLREVRQAARATAPGSEAVWRDTVVALIDKALGEEEA